MGHCIHTILYGLWSECGGDGAKAFRTPWDIVCIPSYTDFDQNAGEMGQKTSDLRFKTTIVMRAIVYWLSPECEGDGAKGFRFPWDIVVMYAIVYWVWPERRRDGAKGFRFPWDIVLMYAIAYWVWPERRRDGAKGFRFPWRETLSLCHRILILIRMRRRWGKRL